jgi:hypothetical protein
VVFTCKHVLVLCARARSYPRLPRIRTPVIVPPTVWAIIYRIPDIYKLKNSNKYFMYCEGCAIPRTEIVAPGKRDFGECLPASINKNLLFPPTILLECVPIHNPMDIALSNQTVSRFGFLPPHQDKRNCATIQNANSIPNFS